MKRIFASFLVAVLLATAGFGAYSKDDINYDNVSNAESLQQLLRDLFENIDSDSILLEPTDTAPSGEEGMLYANDSSNALYYHNGTDWTLVDLGSGTSLDGAYDLGAKITADGTNGVEIEVGASDDNVALLLDSNENTNNNDALQITVAGTGDAISLNGASTGNLIYDESGNFTVASTGALSAATITATTDLTMTGTSYDIVWDSSENTLEVNDDAVVAFGDGDDATLMYDETTDDALELAAAAADTAFSIGGTSAGFDMTYYSETSGTMLWDYDGDIIVDGINVQINDNDQLMFGDSEEFVIDYDEAASDNLIFVAGTANDAVQIGDASTGTDFICVSSAGTTTTHAAWFDASGNTNEGIWKFGNDDHGLDVEFYGETASQLVTWDQSADTWYFGDDGEGVDVYFNTDTGGAYVLWDASGNEAIFEGVDVGLQDDDLLIFGDDNDITIQYDEDGDDDLQITGAVSFDNTVTFGGGQTRKVVFTPTDVELDGTNPPGTTSVGTDGQAVFDALNFDATGADGDDVCFINWVAPDGYKADSASLNVYWSYSDAEDAADDIEIDGTVNAVAAGEAIDAAGTAMTAVAATMTGNTDNDKLIKTSLDIEVETIAVGDMVCIQFWVDESASELANSGTADVHYFEIEYESTE